MNEIPYLSVIIPTCHRNDLLALCLDQLKPNLQKLGAEYYEVIVTDDGAHTTAESMLQLKYPWARWIKGPRKGPAANRNNGAKHAKGNWLVFTDDDCIPEQGWLQAYTEAIVKNINIEVFEGKTICKIGIKSPLETAPINETGGYLWSCNFAINRSLFVKLQGFNEDFPFAHMEDVHFREKILLSNNIFNFVPNAVIDHPPREMASATKLAEQHESEYYFFVVLKKQPPLNFLLLLLKNTLRFRLKNIISRKFSKDSIIAFYKLVVECWYTIILFFKWERKYAQK